VQDDKEVRHADKGRYTHVLVMCPGGEVHQAADILDPDEIEFKNVEPLVQLRAA